MSETADSIDRIEKYLRERSQIRGLDVEHIHGLHTGTDRECDLLASDLRALLDAASRPSHASEG